MKTASSRRAGSDPTKGRRGRTFEGLDGELAPARRGLDDPLREVHHPRALAPFRPLLHLSNTRAFFLVAFELSLKLEPVHSAATRPPGLQRHHPRCPMRRRTHEGFGSERERECRARWDADVQAACPHLAALFPRAPRRERGRSASGRLEWGHKQVHHGVHGRVGTFTHMQT